MSLAVIFHIDYLADEQVNNSFTYFASTEMCNNTSPCEFYCKPVAHDAHPIHQFGKYMYGLLRICGLPFQAKKPRVAAG